ncbi:hypothetical protein ACG3RN_08465, partial [Pseudomonas aeruginosa]
MNKKDSCRVANVSFARQEAPLSFLEVDQGKGVAFPTDGREAFDSLSETPSIRTFRAILDCSRR